MPLNIDWQQILLHLFNFVILFAILYFLLYAPVKKFMEERCAYYKNLEEEANENLENSKKSKAEYNLKLSECEKEISEKKALLYKELEKTSDDIIKKAEEEAEKIISEARKNAENERTKIIREAQNEISDITSSAIEKIVINSSTSDAYDSFLDSVKRSGANE